MTSRRAVRGFTDEPVSREVLERVLSAVAWSPSGSNLQLWNSYALTGALLAELKTRAEDALQWPSEMRDMPRPAPCSPNQEITCMRQARSASTRSRPIGPRLTCTAPRRGLWAHQKGGFYQDGRFATLLDVVNHYDTQFNLQLSDTDKKDLIEYLKGI